MRDIHPGSGAIRALPQPERSNALRSMLLQHFGSIPGVVCSRSNLEERAAARLSARRKQNPIGVLLALIVASVLTLAPNQRASAATWFLDANLASVHTERWARDSLNQINPGIGFEYQANRTWGLAVGEYTNSYRKTTLYGLADFTPIHLGHEGGWHLDAGMAAGLLGGYTHREVPCAPLGGGLLVRVAAPNGIALNLFDVPNTGAHQSGFIGFQLAVPLSR